MKGVVKKTAKGVVKKTAKGKATAKAQPATTQPADEEEVTAEEAQMGKAGTAAIGENLVPVEPAASTYSSDGKVSKQPKVIVVLERACLETGKVRSASSRALRALTAAVHHMTPGSHDSRAPSPGGQRPCPS